MRLPLGLHAPLYRPRSASPPATSGPLCKGAGDQDTSHHVPLAHDSKLGHGGTSSGWPRPGTGHRLITRQCQSLAGLSDPTPSRHPCCAIPPQACPVISSPPVPELPALSCPTVSSPVLCSPFHPTLPAPRVPPFPGLPGSLRDTRAKLAESSPGGSALDFYSPLGNSLLQALKQSDS